LQIIKQIKKQFSFGFLLDVLVTSLTTKAFDQLNKMLTSNALIKLGSTLNNLFDQVVSSSLFKNTQQDEWSSWFKDGFDVFNEKFGQLVAVEFDKVGLNTK